MAVLLAGWGTETRSWVAHASAGEPCLLVGPARPDDLPDGVTYLGPSVPPDASVDRILRSPGFRPHDPVIAALVDAGVPTTSPTGDWFARRPDPGRIVAVTGSKAKSSTSSLVGAGLRLCGVASRVVGNIGTSVWEPEGRIGDPSGVTVVELSSYQCHDLPAGADVAAITFLAVDHLDWHGTLERYHADKLRLFELTAPGPCLTGSPDVVAAAAGIGIDVRLAATDDPDPRRRNATLAAAIVASLVGRDPGAADDLVDRLVADYPVLPGRFATIGRIGECEVIDDALGSNPTATAAGLGALAGRRVAWLMGGASRGVDLAPLVGPARRVLADGGCVLTFQLAGQLLRDALGRAGVDGAAQEVASLEDAFAAALAWRPDVILFSPSGPTPPDEGNWVDRSARFAALARAAGMTGSRP